MGTVSPARRMNRSVKLRRGERCSWRTRRPGVDGRYAGVAELAGASRHEGETVRSGGGREGGIRSAPPSSPVGSTERRTALPQGDSRRGPGWPGTPPVIARAFPSCCAGPSRSARISTGGAIRRRLPADIASLDPGGALPDRLEETYWPGRRGRYRAPPPRRPERARLTHSVPHQRVGRACCRARACGDRDRRGAFPHGLHGVPHPRGAGAELFGLGELAVLLAKA